MDFKQVFCSFGAVVEGLVLGEGDGGGGDYKEVSRSLVVWWKGVVRGVGVRVVLALAFGISNIFYCLYLILYCFLYLCFIVIFSLYTYCYILSVFLLYLCLFCLHIFCVLGSNLVAFCCCIISLHFVLLLSDKYLMYFISLVLFFCFLCL